MCRSPFLRVSRGTTGERALNTRLARQADDRRKTPTQSGNRPFAPRRRNQDHRHPALAGRRSFGTSGETFGYGQNQHRALEDRHPLYLHGAGWRGQPEKEVGRERAGRPLPTKPNEPGGHRTRLKSRLDRRSWKHCAGLPTCQTGRSRIEPSAAQRAGTENPGILPRFPSCLAGCSLGVALRHSPARNAAPMGRAAQRDRFLHTRRRDERFVTTTRGRAGNPRVEQEPLPAGEMYWRLVLAAGRLQQASPG